MFLLKRIALAAAMSCCSEGAIAQGSAPSKPGMPADAKAAPRQIAGTLPAAAPVAPTPVKPSP